jgi:hypothetical protein
MMAGLPGTGIGGIFYVLIAIAMPIRELFLKAFDRSYSNRWPMITLALGLVVAIIAGIWAEVALLNAFFMWLQGALQTDLGLANAGLGERLNAKSAPVITFMAASAAFISLAGLYIAVRILGFHYARKARLHGRPVRPAFKPAPSLHVRTSEPRLAPLPTSMSASMSATTPTVRSSAGRSTYTAGG